MPKLAGPAQERSGIMLRPVNRIRPLLAPLQHLNRHLYWILCRAAFSLAAALVTVLFAGVIGRYFFGYSPIWMTEFAQLAFVWLSMLGIGVALRQQAHVSLAYLWRRAPRRAKHVQTLLVHLAILFIGVSMIEGGVELITVFSSTNLPGLTVSIKWLNASVLVAGTLICLFQLERLLIDLGVLEGELTENTASRSMMG